MPARSDRGCQWFRPESSRRAPFRVLAQTVAQKLSRLRGHTAVVEPCDSLELRNQALIQAKREVYLDVVLMHSHGVCQCLTHSPDTVKRCHTNTVATTSRNVRKFSGGEYVARLMAELSRVGIAQRIATARKQAGLSQHEFADVLGVHWRTVQDWESPKKDTTPWDHLDEIAQVTGVSRTWLLHGDHGAEVVDAASIDRRLQSLEASVTELAALVRRALELLDAPQADEVHTAQRGEGAR